MKKTLLLNSFAVLGFALMTVSCSKENVKPSGENYAGFANNTGGVSQGCSMSKGYWFASPAAVWPSTGVTVGGHNYTEAEAKAIWNTSNQNGLPDSKKAFTQVVAIKLSSATIGSSASVWSEVTVAEAYLSSLNKLSPSYLPTGNSAASNAAGTIGNWINNNHCN
ncbi:MAG: hypothetical protein ACKO7D_04180 [Bacteroidota bacterium]